MTTNSDAAEAAYLSIGDLLLKLCMQLGCLQSHDHASTDALLHATAACKLYASMKLATAELGNATGSQHECRQVSDGGGSRPLCDQSH